MAVPEPGLRGLIDAHYAPLYRYAYRLSGKAADADDLVQETYGKAAQRMHQLRDADRARPWLYRILRNLYLRRVRNEKRFVPLDGVAEPVAVENEVPLAVEPGRLQAALDELDESFRTPLILFYFEEFSYRDIAEQMDLPIGTVMSRLARAKGFLRTKLTEPDDDSARKGG